MDPYRDANLGAGELVTQGLGESADGPLGGRVDVEAWHWGYPLAGQAADVDDHRLLVGLAHRAHGLARTHAQAQHVHVDDASPVL